MNNFVKGMTDVGQLYPPPRRPYPNTSPDSAWNDVAKSFHQVGDNLRQALKECSDAERKSKQKT